MSEEERKFKNCVQKSGTVSHRIKFNTFLQTTKIRKTNRRQPVLGISVI